MHIVWDNSEQHFYVEFSSDFQGDLSAVKNAKFKTNGPPAWRWFTTGIKALNFLRKNRPVSNLTISPEAMEMYNRLTKVDEQNQQVKQALKEARKIQRKIDAPTKGWSSKLTKEKWWIEASDLPPKPAFVMSLVFDKPKLVCQFCNQPIYFYEQQDPPVCLWCEKQLDNVLKLCHASCQEAL